MRPAAAALPSSVLTRTLSTAGGRPMASYSEKLRDPRWQRVRLEIMQRAQFRCERCSDGASTLNVHHVVYRPGADPWDYPDDDLACLCERCHQEEHEAIDRLRRFVRGSDNPTAIVELVEEYVLARFKEELELERVQQRIRYGDSSRIIEMITDGPEETIKRELRSLALVPLTEDVRQRSHFLIRQLSETRHQKSQQQA